MIRDTGTELHLSHGFTPGDCVVIFVNFSKPANESMLKFPYIPQIVLSKCKEPKVLEAH